MARSSFCMTSVLLLSLVILASASGYEYYQKPDGKEKLDLNSKPDYREQIVKPEEKENLPYQYDQSSKPEGKEKLVDLHAKLVFEKPKPEENEKPVYKKPDYEKPKTEGNEKSLNNKLPKYEQPNQEEKEKLIPSKVGYEKPKSEEKDKLPINYPEYKQPKPEEKDLYVPTKPNHENYEQPKSSKEDEEFLYNKPNYEKLPKLSEGKEKLIPSKVDYKNPKPDFEKPKLEEKEKLPITYPEYKQPKPDQEIEKFLPSKTVPYGEPKPEGEEKLIPSKVDYKNPKPDYEKPKPEEKGKLPITYPEYKQPKPDQEKEKFFPSKPVYGETKPEGKEKIVPTKPIYDEKEYKVPTTISVQGLVYCKTGLKYFPLPGAVAKVTCVAVDEESYKTAQFSVLSKPCDSKGHFYATISSPQYQGKIKDCKAFLNYSPSETCKVPTNINNGISGDLVPSNYKTSSHQKDVTLFSVGPFFYTSPVDQTYNKPPLTNANNGY